MVATQDISRATPFSAATLPFEKYLCVKLKPLADAHGSFQDEQVGLHIRRILIAFK